MDDMVEEALAEMDDIGADHDTIEAIRGLYEKGLVEVFRGESGEFYWRPTHMGKLYAEHYLGVKKK